VFSSVFSVTRLANNEPKPDTIKSLQWFNKQPQGIVLSHPSYGYWIEAIANKSVLLDENTYYLASANLKYNITQDIFNSRNLKKTKEILDNNSIGYIWITSEMKNGLVWPKGKEEGLLFLLRSNETFRQLYKDKNSEIWQVIRTETK
jgi:asparagine N-glycosylation enzyme membrane subunit Stt3